MSVMMGHASIDENGKTIGGTAGDQTGKEVCTRTWYSKPWGFMAIYPDGKIREKIAAAVQAACDNDKIGYDQNQRNTLNTQAKAVNYDLSKITTACECDCSSLINVAVVAAGIGTYGSNGWTTSTLQTQLKALGFKILSASSYLLSSDYCVRGAIYCKAGSHAACGLDDGSKASQTLTAAGITTTSASTSSASSSVPMTISGTTVKAVQTWLNTNFKTGLTVDNAYGPKTKAALVKAFQTTVGGLTVDGIFGTNSKNAAAKNIIKSGSKGVLVTIWQAFLICKGYSAVGNIDGEFGTKTTTATKSFQKASSLTQDGQVGRNTWSAALA
ncbi:MAG: peptidoglycan-binding protein [Clostridia bacterium]|nr:peptidoglycan-binding protein [Clostridia bacterium]